MNMFKALAKKFTKLRFGNDSTSDRPPEENKQPAKAEKKRTSRGFEKSRSASSISKTKFDPSSFDDGGKFHEKQPNETNVERERANQILGKLQHFVNLNRSFRLKLNHLDAKTFGHLVVDMNDKKFSNNSGCHNRETLPNLSSPVPINKSMSRKKCGVDSKHSRNLEEHKNESQYCVGCPEDYVDKSDKLPHSCSVHVPNSGDTVRIPSKDDATANVDTNLTSSGSHSRDHAVKHYRSGTISYAGEPPQYADVKFPNQLDGRRKKTRRSFKMSSQLEEAFSKRATVQSSDSSDFENYLGFDRFDRRRRSTHVKKRRKRKSPENVFNIEREYSRNCREIGGVTSGEVFCAGARENHGEQGELNTVQQIERISQNELRFLQDEMEEFLCHFNELKEKYLL